MMRTISLSVRDQPKPSSRPEGLAEVEGVGSADVGPAAEQVGAVNAAEHAQLVSQRLLEDPLLDTAIPPSSVQLVANRLVDALRLGGGLRHGDRTEEQRDENHAANYEPKRTHHRRRVSCLEDVGVNGQNWRSAPETSGFVVRFRS